MGHVTAIPSRLTRENLRDVVWRAGEADRSASTSTLVSRTLMRFSIPLGEERVWVAVAREEAEILLSLRIFEAPDETTVGSLRAAA